MSAEETAFRAGFMWGAWREWSTAADHVREILGRQNAAGLWALASALEALELADLVKGEEPSSLGNSDEDAGESFASWQDGHEPAEPRAPLRLEGRDPDFGEDPTWPVQGIPG